MFKLLLGFLIVGHTLCAQTIEEIRLVGLEKTNEEFVRDFLYSKLGNTYDKEVFAEDFASLNRLNLFFSLDSSIRFQGEKVILECRFVEAYYLYPIAYVDGFNDIIKTQVGFNQINFRGRFQNLGAQHQWYGRHSFSLYWKAPFLTRKWGLEASAAKYSTIEPLFGLGRTSEFNFDNYSLQFSPIRWLNTKTKLGVSLAGFKEFYRQNDTINIGIPGTDFEFEKGQVKVFLEHNNLQYREDQVDGFQVKSLLETVQTKGFPEASFLKGEIEAKWFHSVGERINLAARLKSGWATNNESPFSPYGVDGFVNVRGAGNRIARGTAIQTVNLEFRNRLLRHPWCFVQMLALVDCAFLREPGANYEWNTNQVYTSYGIGTRVQLRKFYKTVFRLDVATLERNFEPQLVFGFNHYF